MRLANEDGERTETLRVRLAAALPEVEPKADGRSWRGDAQTVRIKVLATGTKLEPGSRILCSVGKRSIPEDHRSFPRPIVGERLEPVSRIWERTHKRPCHRSESF